MNKEKFKIKGITKPQKPSKKPKPPTIGIKEEFDEVFEDELETNCDWECSFTQFRNRKNNYGGTESLDEFVDNYIGDNKVKISAKKGKIVIEKLEE